MNIKVVWAFALISVCIVLVAADDSADDRPDRLDRPDDRPRFLKKWKKRKGFKRIEATETDPEVNADGSISVNIKDGGEASIDSNPPSGTLKKRYSKKKSVYAGVDGENGGVQIGDDNNNRLVVNVKKRVVKRKRVKTYVNTEDNTTPNQSEGDVVVSVKKKPVIKRKKVKPSIYINSGNEQTDDGVVVSVNKRPLIKRKKVKASVYVNSGYEDTDDQYGTTTPRDDQSDGGVAISVNKRPLIYKRKGLKTGVYVNGGFDDSTSTNGQSVYIRGRYNRRPAVIKKKNLKISVDNNNNGEFDDQGVDINVNERPIVVGKKKTFISIDADGTDDDVEQRPVVVAKKKYKASLNVDYNDKEGGDNSDYPSRRPVRVQKGKFVSVGTTDEDLNGGAVVNIQKRPIFKRNRVVVNAGPINYDTDDTIDDNNDVSISIEGNKLKTGRVSLFGSVPASTVKVAVGGTPAKILEGPIRQAEIIDKAVKALVTVVSDTVAKNVKVVEHRIANLFTFGVDNIGGVVSDVQIIKKNNNRAIRDIVAVLSSSVDNSVGITVDGVGDVIHGIGFGATGEGIFKNTVDCILGTLKNVLWTKLNVLEYIYRIKTQFLTFGIFNPISVLPKIENKIGVCLAITKIKI